MLHRNYNKVQSRKRLNELFLPNYQYIAVNCNTIDAIVTILSILQKVLVITRYFLKSYKQKNFYEIYMSFSITTYVYIMKIYLQVMNINDEEERVYIPTIKIHVTSRYTIKMRI